MDIILHGHNWESCTPYDKNLYAGSALYLICYFDKNKVIHILYIGESIRFYIRCRYHSVYKHLSTLHPNLDLFFLYSPFPEKRLKGREDYLIRKIKPKYNGKYIIREGIVRDIKKSMDGRKNRWLAKKMNINEGDLSKKLRGLMEITTTDVENINSALGTNFKI